MSEDENESPLHIEELDAIDESQQKREEKREQKRVKKQQKQEYIQKKRELKETEAKIQALEDLVQETSIVAYNPECVRKKSNWSKPADIFKFDNAEFAPDHMRQVLEHYSPKLHTLLEKIADLDAKDKRQHGKLYKHFIFSDLKFGNYGAKLLASALISAGYNLGYTAESREPRNRSAKKRSVGGAAKSRKRYDPIQLHSDEVLKQTSDNNFYMLSSVGVYDQNITVKMKKEMLRRFNERPENAHGDLVRFIVLDSGFKEGIDLFDVKYVHIFEPPTYLADQKQVIGRSTRTCGQKGIEFHPTFGWPLHVFIYDLTIPESIQRSLMGSKTAMELYLKSMNLDLRLLNFTNDLEQTTIVGSVDYDLNKNVHSFSIPSSVSGGAGQPDPVNLADILRGIVSDTGPRRLTHAEMRAHIQKYYSEFAWDVVKMENLCEDKGRGGSGQILTYTPTQDFIRHYFHPMNPIRGMLLYQSVGTGKCHAKDTPILMYDGTVKLVQDVLVGDTLMGDDSTPRKVLSLARGKDEMYDIIPVKGDTYRVNSEHILCLKFSGRGSIINVAKSQPNLPFKTTMINNKTFKKMSKSFKTREEALDYLNTFTEEDRILQIEVKDYLKLPNAIKRELKGYRKSVEFAEKPIAFDPYIIGLWLGDGSSRESVFTSQDAKILKYLRDNTRKYGLLLNYQSKYDYRLSKDGTTKTNLLIDELHKYNLINNKHIPYDYKCNTREVRLKMLAGIIDTDGYYCKKGKLFCIIQKSEVLANDIVFLARSLGYAAYSSKVEKSCMYKGEKKTGIYNSITISGNNMDEIPTLLARKRAEKREQIKDVLLTGVTVSPAGQGDYYGFCIDENRRYLMGDFTVTHNTCSAIAAATSNFEKNGYTILWVTRTTLKNDIWKNMFDQVCNESIRNQIEYQDLEIPKDHGKRMRLLSPAWRIRPMSYKQFSNLILKQNAMYESLVKINGTEDPLRKTLLIIDEAHKLYGGDDLSTIEKPDMDALKRALLHSYQFSGQDSARLLLMTATPITKDPMELIKLVNLCKPAAEQMPTEFADFSAQYLDESGNFTADGRTQYLDDIAGYVSYLNREKDARQFAQPQIETIQVPIVKDPKDVEKFDKRIMRELLDAGAGDIAEQLTTESKKLKGELGQVSKAKFEFLKDKNCGDLSGKPKKQCEKVVNKNVTQLVKEVKDSLKEIKAKVKELRTAAKAQKKLKTGTLKEIIANIGKYSREYEKYKTTQLYELKTKCAKRIRTMGDIDENIRKHPAIARYDKEIARYNTQISGMETDLKQLVENYKGRMRQLKGLLKTDLSPVERNVVNMVIREERDEYGRIRRQTKRQNKHVERDLRKDIKAVEKQRSKRKRELIKKIRKTIKDERKQANVARREVAKLRKTARIKSKGVVKHEVLKNLVTKYQSKIMEELVDVAEADREQEAAKEQEKMAKERAKMEKAAEKEQKKMAKLAEREHARETKKRMQEEKKAAREQEKLAKKAARKTRKNSGV